MRHPKLPAQQPTGGGGGGDSSWHVRLGRAETTSGEVSDGFPSEEAYFVARSTVQQQYVHTNHPLPVSITAAC